MTKKIKIEAQVKDPNRLPTEFILRIIKSKLEYDMMKKLEKYIIEAKPNNDNIIILPKKRHYRFHNGNYEIFRRI